MNTTSSIDFCDVRHHGWAKRLGAMACVAVLAASLVACGGGGDTGEAAMERERPTEVAVQSSPFVAPVTGAVYTSDNNCMQVNGNIYATKDDVWLNGGPVGGSSGLPEGDYYVQVTDPSGADLLGKTLTASVHINADGKFASCYQLSAILYSDSSGFAVLGYDNTLNSGGEYKVWVSKDPNFTNSLTKTDNFKVREGGCGDACVPVETAWLKIEKCYDANANGVCEADEVRLQGWKVSVMVGDSPASDVATTYLEEVALPSPSNQLSATASEYMPAESNWVATGPGPFTVTLTPEDTEANPETIRFANLCTGAGGGLTLGFWSNRNGQALITTTDGQLTAAAKAALGPNLRTASGGLFVPGTYAAFRTWILGASATNMAYMLSAQLAAMELNVLNSKVSATSLIYVGTSWKGTAVSFTGLQATGFATAQAVMDAANMSLATNGNTTAAGDVRNYQEALKNALDGANNNKNFVQAAPCVFTFQAP